MEYYNFMEPLCYICYDLMPQRASSVVFSLFPSLGICLFIARISKTIIKFKIVKISFWNNSACDALKYFLFEI